MNKPPLQEILAAIAGLAGENRAEVLCRQIAGHFAVQEHEVGLFEIDTASRMAVLRAPRSLGSPLVIPVHLAGASLLASTIKERRGVLDNDFAARPHLHMVERTLSEREQRLPVQKIMSVPVVAGGEVRWVIQVTRKGETRDLAGPDFTPADLQDLEKIAGALAERI